MPDTVRESIYEAIASIRLIDPHTHINPHSPASSTLADLLGYHYYTELAHSAGMPKELIEEADLQPRELVRRLVTHLSPIENTAQYRWLVEICRTFFGFEGDRIDLTNWEEVYDAAERQMRMADWPQMILDQSNVEAVFLTNDFDDELTGFDTDTYIPCLRTDDLVFHLAKLETRQRLAGCTGIELDGSLRSLRESLKQRFEHFVGRGARACAISLPPSFEPNQVSDGRAQTALEQVLRLGPQADPSHQSALSRRVFWTLAELCDEYGLPFDLMIGVNRGVYTDGVFQGQDLYDSRVSLIQYRELFNSFPDVKFPISVLASVTNQELVSYAWIFPNVITNGHWWYSNTPSFIARDAAARLEAVPQTKQIAYYSDAYKLEFVLPKFDMYRRVLSGILADYFVKECKWSEERAIELGRQVLRDNIDEVFPRPVLPVSSATVDTQAETWTEDNPIARPTNEEIGADPIAGWEDPAQAGTSAALAAGAIGMVEVTEAAEEFSSEATQDQPAAAESPESDAEATAFDAEAQGFDAEAQGLDVGPRGLDAEPVAPAAETDWVETEPLELEAADAEQREESDLDDADVSDEEFATIILSDTEATLPSTDSSIDAEADAESSNLSEADFEPPLEETALVDPTEVTHKISSTAETVRMDELDSGEFDLEEAFEEADESPEMIEETSEPDEAILEIESSELQVAEQVTGEASFDAEQPTSPPSDHETIEDLSQHRDELEATVELDPLPSQGELQAVEVDDVELRKLDISESAPDSESIEAEAAPEPLDVGDLLADDETPSEGVEEIRPLRGEDSFMPDEESLQLQPDPLTGELTFPLPSDSDVPSESVEPVTDPGDGEDLEIEELTLQDTIEEIDESEITFQEVDDSGVEPPSEQELVLEDTVDEDAPLEIMFDDEDQGDDANVLFDPVDNSEDEIFQNPISDDSPDEKNDSGSISP